MYYNEKKTSSNCNYNAHWKKRLYYATSPLHNFLLVGLGVCVSCLWSQHCWGTSITKLYWAVEGDTVIRRANLDGSEREELIRTPGGIQPDIAIDSVAGKMYWPSPEAGGIQRGNLDGTEPETVIADLHRPIFTAIDEVHRKVYWIDVDSEQRDHLWRSNLDGTDRELLIEEMPRATALEVDPIGGYYYWAEQLRGTIYRTKLDNSQTEIVLDGTAFGRNPLPTGIALDIASGYLYASDLVLNAIVHVSLDGSGPTLLITEGVETPRAIGFDPVGERIYWGNSYPDKHILSANRNGVDVQQHFLPTDFGGMAADGTKHIEFVQLPIPEPSTMLLLFCSCSSLTVFPRVICRRRR